MRINFKFIIPLFFIIAVLAVGLVILLKEPKIVFSDTELEQGDTLLVRLDSVGVLIRARLDSNPVSFFRFHKNYFAIIGIDANAKTGKLLFSIKLFFGKELTRELIIQRHAFPITKFIVPEKLAERGISAANLAQSVESNDELVINSIFKIFTPKVAFSESFGEPLEKWIDVGNFGVLRQFKGGGVRHVGVDLAAKSGEPVFSINAGTVRFAGELKNFGKTVIIDHGMGIFSGYLHLTEINVGLNSRVKRGEIIGSVGSSGEYSLEPHLHFTIKIRGTSVDPRKFLDTAKQFLN